MVTGDEMGVCMVSRKSKSGLLIILLSIICFACQRYASVEEVTWFNDFLFDPVCELPCWENITPGITKSLDVEKELLKIQDISKVYLSPSGKSYSWDFVSEEGDGIVWIDEKTQLVSSIEFTFGEKHPSCESIIETLGEPRLVWIALSPGGKYNVSLIYPDKGLMLDLGLISGKDRVKVSAYQNLFAIVLYADDKQYRTSLWQEWNGFDVYYSVLGTP